VPKRRRHAARPAADEAPGTSVLEIALYGLFGALVAAGVLIVAGNPIWQAIVIVVGTIALLAVLAIVSARSTGQRAEPSVASSTGTRHGRRRRR
jgi:VIT1/CCC1 family predicted Fe2+/Mn2+ transporter